MSSTLSWVVLSVPEAAHPHIGTIALPSVRHVGDRPVPSPTELTVVQADAALNSRKSARAPV